MRYDSGFSLFSSALFLLLFSLISAFVFYLKTSITNNQNKALIMQIKNYNFALNNFTQKYHGIPGDIQQTEFFGISEDNSDGNADNIINDENQEIIEANGEITNFWMHLSNSDLLNEKYLGKKNQEAKIGISFPASRIGENVGIVAFGIDGKNYFQVGFSHTDNKNIIMKDESLTTREAQAIDKKIDDENPSKGFVVVAGGKRLNFLENENCKKDNIYNTEKQFPTCQIRIEIR